MKFWLLTALMALVLTGCGRYGPPSPAGPAADVVYPRTYPAQ